MGDMRAVPAGTQFRVALFTSARSWRGSCVSLANIAAGLIIRGHEAVLLTGEEAIAETARKPRHSGPGAAHKKHRMARGPGAAPRHP
jgi:hypothetical protein